MELGATLCTPRDPQCPACPIRTTCAAFRLRRVADFPQIPQRKKPRQRRFIAYILRHGDSVLVRKRSSGVVNGNLWEFPNFEVIRGSTSESAAALAGRFIHLKPRPFATIKHTITNNRITLQASHAEVNGESAALETELSAKWHPIVALDQLPFSSAHARLRSLLLSGS
jgi:A/G-specific adenine glycosylase